MWMSCNVRATPAVGQTLRSTHAASSASHLFSGRVSIMWESRQREARCVRKEGHSGAELNLVVLVIVDVESRKCCHGQAASHCPHIVQRVQRSARAVSASKKKSTGKKPETRRPDDDVRRPLLSHSPPATLNTCIVLTAPLCVHQVLAGGDWAATPRTAPGTCSISVVRTESCCAGRREGTCSRAA